MGVKKDCTETQYDSVPDGGWGWVVVTCSFFVMFMFDGIFASYGLLLPVLMESLDASPSLTSLAGSLMIGSLLLVALLACVLVERFGCRKVAIAGAFVACLGLLLSSFASNIWMFLVTYGFLAGCGMGLLYLPTVIIVNKYFDKKRGIAQSIMTAGSGIGVMIISPLVEMLLDVYNWRGCLIILAGLFLQLCVACAFYRLPKVMHVQNKIRDTSPLDETTDDGRTEYSNLLYPGINGIEHDNDVEKHFYTLKKSDFHEHGSHSFLKHPNFKSSTRSLPRSMFIANLHEKRNSSNFCSSRCISNTPNTLLTSNSTRTDSKSILSQKDIFYCGSLKHMKHLSSHSEMSSPRKEVGLSSISIGNSDIIPYKIENSLNSCTGSWLNNKYFWVVASSAFLTQMAQFIPTMFLGDLGMSIGLNSKDVAWIFSVFGVVNTFGRLIPGFIIDKTRMTSNTLYTIGMVGCAISCFVFPACRDYPSLMIVTSVFGFFIAFPIPVQPIMVLDSVGIDNLTKGLGFVTVLKGPAAVTGPPLAGALYEWAKNYDVTNIFAGCLCLGTVVILIILPVYQCIFNICNRRDGRYDCDKSDS